MAMRWIRRSGAIECDMSSFSEVYTIDCVEFVTSLTE